MVLWVFGYGSLVYNFGFDYDEKVVGFIKGHKPVFDLACIDHRGTPEYPARTCTLEAGEGEICWGAAFCVKRGPEKERLAIEYWERRECGYDLKASVDFYRDKLMSSFHGQVLHNIKRDQCFFLLLNVRLP
ncbi:hypothetical protein MKW92_050139 [Papaver armeniacum]|nr:hypothetical protein MKW92_050139 [Papaver armeniacum]